MIFQIESFESLDNRSKFEKPRTKILEKKCKVARRFVMTHNRHNGIAQNWDSTNGLSQKRIAVNGLDHFLLLKIMFFILKIENLFRYARGPFSSEHDRGSNLIMICVFADSLEVLDSRFEFRTICVCGQDELQRRAAKMTNTNDQYRSCIHKQRASTCDFVAAVIGILMHRLPSDWCH